MASARYTLNIDPEDLKPQEERTLTPLEKVDNWWYYHWKIVLLAGVVALLVGTGIYEYVTQVKPDYRVGVITRYTLPDEAVEQLQAALSQKGQDLNGDGQAVVFVDTYTMDMRPPQVVEAERLAAADDPEAGGQDMMANMETVASQTRLMADLETRECMFYLTDDPAGLQTLTGILGTEKGEPLADSSQIQGAALYPWQSCPVLESLPLGEYTDVMGENARPSRDAFKDLVLVRRAFPQGKEMPLYQAETEALFYALIQGAQAR